MNLLIAPDKVLRESAMNLHETQASQAANEPPPTRFLYASGARPLDGYTIKRGIGRGGFGEVYFATSDGGKEVALKLIRRNMDVEIRGVGHCMNLKHPNLLSVHDVRRDSQGETWIIMEYVSGASLEDVIASNPKGLNQEEVLAWFHGIADGLAYLHEHGIVHRDLKPGNIFQDEGIVKIGDYGLSKFISCSRRSGQTESVGTVHYMAPEVANGRYGKEIDVYALAVILYELLTGEVPFEGESVGEVLMKHLTAEPKLDAIAEPFRSALRRGLSKDPANRFASAREFAAALPRSTGGAPAAGVYQVHSSFETPKAKPAPAASGATRKPDAWWNDPNREPIYHGIKNGLAYSGRLWNRARIPTILRVVFMLLMLYPAAALAFAAPRIAIVALPLYGVYYVARALLLAALGYEAQMPAPSPPKTPQMGEKSPRLESLDPSAVVRPIASGPIPVATAVAEVPSKEQRKRRWSQRAVFKIPAKTARQHFTELLGGMLVASIVASFASAAATFLTVHNRNDLSVGDISQGAWLAVVSTLGAWMVLAASKQWEGRDGDPHHRRFALMCGGGCLGLAAYCLKVFLNVAFPYRNDLSDPLDMNLNWFQGNPWMWETNGQPAIGAMIAYFATVFVIVRWWKNADPLRAHRLGVFATLVPVLLSWGLSTFITFPQPVGLTCVAIMVVAVELSSPWIPLEDRKTAEQSV